MTPPGNLKRVLESPSQRPIPTSPRQLPTSQPKLPTGTGRFQPPPRPMEELRPIRPTGPLRTNPFEFSPEVVPEFAPEVEPLIAEKIVVGARMMGLTVAEIFSILSLGLITTGDTREPDSSIGWEFPAGPMCTPDTNRMDQAKKRFMLEMDIETIESQLWIAKNSGDTVLANFLEQKLDEMRSQLTTDTPNSRSGIKATAGGDGNTAVDLPAEANGGGSSPDDQKKSDPKDAPSALEKFLHAITFGRFGRTDSKLVIPAPPTAPVPVALLTFKSTVDMSQWNQTKPVLIVRLPADRPSNFSVMRSDSGLGNEILSATSGDTIKLDSRAVSGTPFNVAFDPATARLKVTDFGTSNGVTVTVGEEEPHKLQGIKSKDDTFHPDRKHWQLSQGQVVTLSLGTGVKVVLLTEGASVPMPEPESDVEQKSLPPVQVFINQHPPTALSQIVTMDTTGRHATVALPATGAAMTFAIGRASARAGANGDRLNLNDLSVSRDHAEVTWDPKRREFSIADKGSKCGTRNAATGEVVGSPIKRPIPPATTSLRYGVGSANSDVTFLFPNPQPLSTRPPSENATVIGIAPNARPSSGATAIPNEIVPILIALNQTGVVEARYDHHKLDDGYTLRVKPTGGIGSKDATIVKISTASAAAGLSVTSVQKIVEQMSGWMSKPSRDIDASVAPNTIREPRQVAVTVTVVTESEFRRIQETHGVIDPTAECLVDAKHKVATGTATQDVGQHTRVHLLVPVMKSRLVQEVPLEVTVYMIAGSRVAAVGHAVHEFLTSNQDLLRSPMGQFLQRLGQEIQAP